MDSAKRSHGEEEALLARCFRGDRFDIAVPVPALLADSSLAMLKTYLAVMAGGALGTALRMAVSTWFVFKFGEAFPLGTLIVNVSGCFIIGAFAALTGPQGPLVASQLTRQVVMIGFLGGYTTFSSFSLQTLNLWQKGELLRAALNTSLSLVLCLIAVWIGHASVGLFQHR